MSSEKKPVVQETSNDEFINLLREQIDNGGGFVPFVGSGCSSPSGISAVIPASSIFDGRPV